MELRFSARLLFFYSLRLLSLFLLQQVSSDKFRTTLDVARRPELDVAAPQLAPLVCGNWSRQEISVLIRPLRSREHVHLLFYL